MKTNYLWRNATHAAPGLLTALCLLAAGPGPRCGTALAATTSKDHVFKDLSGPSAPAARPAVPMAPTLAPVQLEMAIPAPPPNAAPARTNQFESATKGKTLYNFHAAD
ncbi:MAG: hypothetical protein WCQ21_30325, partial [Verrucomicrobiota bacterium]